MARLVELILTKPGKEPMFRYYPVSDGTYEVFVAEMVKVGWSAHERELNIVDYDHRWLCSFLEGMAYRFYEKDREAK